MRLDAFLVAMLSAVCIALWQPWLGAAGGPLRLDVVVKIGIALIFFLHGASLSREALRLGAVNWPLHLFIQASTFILFPAVGFGIFSLAPAALPDDARLGLFYLCAVSSTISSSVAMVGIARGNVAAAVFNASLSGLIAIIVTPILVGLVSTAGTGEFSMLDAIGDIATTLLLPFAAGQVSRPLLRDIIARFKSWITLLDRGVIVLIVFISFCQSTADGLWSRYDPLKFVMVATIVATLLACALAMMTLLSRVFHLTREDEIAAVFCGSQKSLANGAPVAQILFGTNPALGMILLPLLLYHQFQLLVSSHLAQRYASTGDADPAVANTDQDRARI